RRGGLVRLGAVLRLRLLDLGGLFGLLDLRGLGGAGLVRRLRVGLDVGRRLSGLAGGRLARGLLGLRLGRQRLARRLAGGAADERRIRDAVEHALDPHLDLLADEPGSVAYADREAVELADGRRAVVAVDLQELDLQLGSLGHRRLRREVRELALAEDDEVVEVQAVLALEEEAALRQRLQLDEPPRGGPYERTRDRCRDLDAEGLRARAGGQRAQAPLHVDRGRGLGVDDPVAAAGRALAGHDLARAVGDVLARHLDEAERRDLDDVGLRAVALELAAQRLLDRRAVLRVGHVDEVDDDDPADVAQAQLAHDLLPSLAGVPR